MNEYQLILQEASAITIQCNDYFDYASAEAVTISTDNLDWINPIVFVYGITGLYACIAYIIGREPLIAHQTEKYKACLAHIKEANPHIYEY